MTASSPKVSILVPIYNVSRYLRECMDSLVSQTLKDIEIVCINDGSTDDSLDILNEYARTDSRVVVISKPNGGLPSARNAALNVARGEYVGFVDSDDYVSRDMYEIMYNKAMNRKSEIVVCGAVLLPKDPSPDEWFKTVLSPRDVHYSKFTKEVLSEAGSQPFVWRMIVKRSLIEENKIRFDESIIIGEDLGFQLRIYPRAQRITFISDKLYFYRWMREGSIMDSSTYSDCSKRVVAHIALIDHIRDSWSKTKDLENMRKEFMEWSVALIYDDLIKLSASERVLVSEKICDIWDKAGYWSCKGLISKMYEDMFEYIYSLRGKEYPEPELTIVVMIENHRYWIESCIQSILNQTKKDIEILCINNGTHDGTFIHLHNALRKDHRVSLFNQDVKSSIECYQLGLANAKGKYVMFIDSSDCLLSNDALESVCTAMTDDVDVVCYNTNVNFFKKSAGIKIDSDKTCSIGEFREFASIHQLVFKTSYLCPLVRELRDYSWFNEWMFMAKVQKGNGTVRLMTDKFYEINKTWVPDRVATWQANMFLDAAIELVKESYEPGFFWMQEQVISTMNSDYVIRLIVENTMPSIKKPEDDPEGMASEVETWCKILDLNSIIDTSRLDKSLLRIVEVYVTERHGFLDKMLNLEDNL